jgi:hypothetical protein
LSYSEVVRNIISRSYKNEVPDIVPLKLSQTDSSQVHEQRIKLGILPPRPRHDGPTNISTASTSPLSMAGMQSFLSADTAVIHTCLPQRDIDEFMAQMAVVQREIARLQAIHARLRVSTVRTPTPQTPTTATIASSSSKGSWFKRLSSKFG